MPVGLRSATCRVAAWLTLSVALLIVSGCGKSEPPAPVAAPSDQPAAESAAAEPAASTAGAPQPSPTTPAVEETGTVKVEFDIVVDPKAVITISGSEYSPQDLEQELRLKPGQHTLTVKHPGLDLPPREFTVESGKRRMVRVYEPNRHAAEWVLRVGGQLFIFAGEMERQVTNLADLPEGAFSTTVVNLDRKTVRDADLANLDGLARLRNLSLAHTAITGSGFVNLKDSPVLDEIVANGTKLTDEGLKLIRGLKKIRILRLSQTPITDVGIAHIAGFDLAILQLSHTQISDAALKHIGSMPSMWILGLESTKITDEGLRHFEGMSKLAELNISVTRVTDEGLKHLRTCPKLSRLRLGRTQVSDSGLMHLKGMNHPGGGLWLNDTQVTGDGLRHLSELTSIGELHLDNTQVTDSGLVHLKGLSQLGRLVLRGTQVSDAGLVHLKGLTSLRELYLKGTQVTNAGVADLKAALPNCQIQR